MYDHLTDLEQSKIYTITFDVNENYNKQKIKCVKVLIKLENSIFEFSQLIEGKDQVLARLGALLETVDAYDPLPAEYEVIDCRYEAHRGPWEDATRLRRDGRLLAMGSNIECPVVAIHGDHDPHPAEGVRGPLSALLGDFSFVLLERCGHKPWIERWAKEAFFRFLGKEL